MKTQHDGKWSPGPEQQAGPQNTGTGASNRALQ